MTGVFDKGSFRSEIKGRVWENHNYRVSATARDIGQPERDAWICIQKRVMVRVIDQVQTRVVVQYQPKGFLKSVAHVGREPEIWVSRVDHDVDGSGEKSCGIRSVIAYGL